MANISGGCTNIVCFRGRVELFPQTGIGATNGRIFTTAGLTIRIRQVPGPNNSGIPLSQAGGRFVTVCGNFIHDRNQMILNVTTVRPILFRDRE